MTIFVTRKTIRDGLVALFTANDSWEVVYGYIPKVTTIDGKSPLLVITSAGTDQSMAGLNTNPAEYTFTFVSFVRMDDSVSGGTWSEDDAEDKLDELDTVFRQVVRDNAGGGSFADSLMFADTQSRTDYAMIDGVGYRTEEWILTAHHYSGA